MDPRAKAARDPSAMVPMTPGHVDVEGGSGIIQMIGNAGFDNVELSDQQENSVH
jgi:hypothetical protein